MRDHNGNWKSAVTRGDSYRRILRTSSIVGGASVINILIALVRTKVAAVLLGPAGIGWIGLLQSVMATASTIAALGVGTVGTRQIAHAHANGDETALALNRRAVMLGGCILGLAGGVVVWLLREPLARYVLNDASAAVAVGWVAPGVALSVVAMAQAACLNGFRRIGELATLSIVSAVLLTLAGLCSLLWLQEKGVLAFVLAAPAANFVAGLWFLRRLPRLDCGRIARGDLLLQWRTMAGTGVAFMASGLVVTVGHLVVRSIVHRQLGTEALGNFQAAWAISMTYIGFVLSAMGTDYFPALTSVMHDRQKAARLVNEQTEIALLVAGPIFIGMLAMAPWIVDVLYSAAFQQTEKILRWQILGDLMKVASWPLGFVIVAAGDGRTFIWTESLAIAVFVAFIWLGMPTLGIEATGFGFLLMYLVYGPIVYWLARRRIGLRWSGHVTALFGVLLVLSVIVVTLGDWSRTAGCAFGVPVAMLMLVYALARIGLRAELGGRVGQLAALLHRLMVRMRITHE